MRTASLSEPPPLYTLEPKPRDEADQEVEPRAQGHDPQGYVTAPYPPKSADAILATIERFCLRISNAGH